MIVEYRHYQAAPGRLDDLHRRFSESVMPLFEKHQIGVVGFWVPIVGVQQSLHYILRWGDLAERQARWGNFVRDPDWQEARRVSEESGPLVSRSQNELWAPTPYSPEVSLGAGDTAP